MIQPPARHRTDECLSSICIFHNSTVREIVRCGRFSTLLLESAFRGWMSTALFRVIHCDHSISATELIFQLSLVLLSTELELAHVSDISFMKPSFESD